MFPCADADRDGSDERGGRPGNADPSRLGAQSQPAGVLNATAVTWVRDVPTRTDYVNGLRPLLDLFGNDQRLTLILFTLDESTYSRELAPLAGHYPALKLGPAWWFHDSPEGMMRYREQVTETAGFLQHGGLQRWTHGRFFRFRRGMMWPRRVDAAFLARLVAERRLDEDEAMDLNARVNRRSGAPGVPSVVTGVGQKRKSMSMKHPLSLEGPRRGGDRWNVRHWPCAQPGAGGGRRRCGEHGTPCRAGGGGGCRD